MCCHLTPHGRAGHTQVRAAGRRQPTNHALEVVGRALAGVRPLSVKGLRRLCHGDSDGGASPRRDMNERTLGRRRSPTTVGEKVPGCGGQGDTSTAQTARAGIGRSFFAWVGLRVSRADAANPRMQHKSHKKMASFASSAVTVNGHGTSDRKRITGRPIVRVQMVPAPQEPQRASPEMCRGSGAELHPPSAVPQRVRATERQHSVWSGLPEESRRPRWRVGGIRRDSERRAGCHRQIMAPACLSLDALPLPTELEQHELGVLAKFGVARCVTRARWAVD